MEVIIPERCQKYFELQCNGRMDLYTDPPIKLIKPWFDKIFATKPLRILELGCGIGRMSVYFFLYYGLQDAHFFLLDGNSGDQQVNGVRGNNNGEFYNSWKATAHFCEANGLMNRTILRTQEIPPDLDLTYSFFSIGFHWSIELYLKEVVKNTRRGGYILFDVRTSQDDFYAEQISIAYNNPSCELEGILDIDPAFSNKVLLLRKL